MSDTATFDHTTIRPDIRIDEISPGRDITTSLMDMPEGTIEEMAAKWLRMKEMENAGNTAKSERSRLGSALSGRMLHEQRVTVGGRSYTFKASTGRSSGITAATINAFKARYHRVPWIAPALDAMIEENKTPFDKYTLTLG